jgi:prepilin-type processing-associated H-X9-DG protein
VELLVVIGIIALLISVLMPVLSNARRAANDTMCANNLRQLHIAYIMYANASKGFLPLNQHDAGIPAGLPQNGYAVFKYPWAIQILPYVGNNKKMYLCPVDPAVQAAPAQNISDDWDYFEQQPGRTCSYHAKFDLGSVTFAPSARSTGVPFGKNPWDPRYWNDGIAGISNTYPDGWQNVRKLNQVKRTADCLLFNDEQSAHVNKNRNYRNVVFLDGHLTKVSDGSQPGYGAQQTVEFKKTEFGRYWWYHAKSGFFDPNTPGHQ